MHVNGGHSRRQLHFKARPCLNKRQDLKLWYEDTHLSLQNWEIKIADGGFNNSLGHTKQCQKKKKKKKREKDGACTWLGVKLIALGLTTSIPQFPNKLASDHVVCGKKVN